MFPYYSLFINFPQPYYNFQNQPPIMTYNYGQEYQYLEYVQKIKKEQETTKNYDFTQLAQTSKSIDEKQNTEVKIQTSLSNDAFEQNQEDQQICEQKNSSLNDNIKKTKLIQKNKLKQIKKKVRGQKKDKAYVAKQYPKQEPSINCRYIQKNFQLNIINQVFSFLWSEQKSVKYIKRYFKSNQIKITLYYQYIKIVRKFCKRYINKQYLRNLCDYQTHHIAYKMVSKNVQKLEYLSMEEFSSCIRHLIFIYLHQLCPQAILTSKKMRRQIWGQHLIKCRLLRDFMFYNLSAQEYEKQLIHNKSDQHKMADSTSQDIMS